MILRLILITAVLVLLPCPMPACADHTEYQAKAAVLYKLALFVDWPPEAFRSPSSPFVLCVWGEPLFGRWMQKELKTHRVGSHPLEVSIVEGAEQVRRAHLLFISRSEEERLQQILHQLGKASVLTVSDMDHFARRGGMVGLVMQGSRMRFELNVAAAEGVGLEIGSGLKRLALTVLFGKEEEIP